MWLLLYEKPSYQVFSSRDLHGTVIDNKVCHPKNNDFYLGTHAGMIGITRQTHYHVLLDQAGFQADDLQEFVHSLSYMYHHSHICCGSYLLRSFGSVIVGCMALVNVKIVYII